MSRNRNTFARPRRRAFIDDDDDIERNFMIFSFYFLSVLNSKSRIALFTVSSSRSCHSAQHDGDDTVGVGWGNGGKYL